MRSVLNFLLFVTLLTLLPKYYSSTQYGGFLIKKIKKAQPPLLKQMFKS